MTHWTLIDIVNALLCVVIAGLWTRLRWLAEEHAERTARSRCECRKHETKADE